MSQSPFDPGTNRSGAKPALLLLLLAAVGAVVVAGVMMLLTTGAGDDTGQRASEPATGPAAGSSGDSTTLDAGPAQLEETVDEPAREDKSEDRSEEEKAEEVAGNYVEAVYGYSGDSGDEYRQAVMEHSQSYDLLSSPGGEDIQTYAEEADGPGLSMDARLTGFEVGRSSEQKVTARVEFVVGDGSEGGITADSETYSQQLSLRPHRETYKVNYATLPEPV